jgi:hypothetical protein
MYGLLMRLSALDTDAAGAVRVIGFFDALVEHGAGIEVVLRQTATLAECPVGARTADGQFSQRMEPFGMVLYGGPPADARTYRLPSGDEVWLERDGAEHPLDDLLIERFALAAAVALGPGRRGIGDMDPCALLRLAISAAASDYERRSALERLGLSPAATVHVTALAGPPGVVHELYRSLPGRCRAEVGGIAVLLAAERPADSTRIPLGGRIGVASAHLAADLPEAWKEARTALRFTLPSRRIEPPYPACEPALVRFENLGGFAAIAETLTAEQISRVPDVMALDKLAEQTGGEETIRTLEAVAATESLRRAAAMLHLHHNSVSYRVTRAEPVIGYSVADPYARPRLMLALIMRRVRASAGLF